MRLFSPVRILLASLIITWSLPGSAGVAPEELAASALSSGNMQDLARLVRYPQTMCVGGQWRRIQGPTDLEGVTPGDLLADPEAMIQALGSTPATDAPGNFRPASVHGEKFFSTEKDSLFMDGELITRIIPVDYRRCALPEISFCKDPAQNRRLAESLQLDLLLGLDLFELPLLSGRGSLGYQSNSDYPIMGMRLPFAREDFVNVNHARGFTQLTLTYDPDSHRAAPEWAAGSGKARLMLVPDMRSRLIAVRGCDGDQEACDLPSARGLQHVDELLAYATVLLARRDKDGKCTLENFYLRDLYPETVAEADFSLRREMEMYTTRGQPQLTVPEGTWKAEGGSSDTLEVKGGRIKIHAGKHNYVFNSFSSIGSAPYFGVLQDPAGKGPLHDHHVYMVPERSAGSSGSVADQMLVLIMKKHYADSTSKILRFGR